MNELFLKMINMSISASWLVLAVLFLRLALKKAPKWVNVLLWGIVAVRLICPFMIESSVSLIPDSVGSGELVSAWVDYYIDDIDIHHPGSLYYDAAIGAGREPIFDGEDGYYVVTKHDQLGEPATIENTVIPVLSIIWVTGMAILALYTAFSYWRLCRKVDTAIRYKDNIFQSEAVNSPFVLGIIKPRIYLPFNINEQDLEHVVAHEQAHIHRKDHWWKPLGFLLLTIHWFNPLMWLAYMLLCRDIELACDERVIKELGNEQRANYTQALVACSVNRRIIAACPLAFGEVGVKERVKSVMNYKKPTFWIIILASFACIIVAVCFLTNPITTGDYFVLTHADGTANTNKLTYEIQLGNEAMSGEIFVEQWINGTCVKSSPVIMTQYVDSIDIIMRDRREDGTSVGTDIQIETNQYGGSLLTYFEHPENFDVVGWSFKGYELNEKSKLTSNEEVILATKTFDNGSGISVYDCQTLVNEPERIKDTAYMIVVRAVFGDDPLGVTNHGESSFSTDVLTLNDVIFLSQKGYNLSWADFEKYDYVETGSGLYIRVYEINAIFHLMIGGGSPDSDPMYIYLALADDLDTRIDIRDGGVTEFISKYGNFAPAYHAKGILHLGLNAEIVEIDTSNHILYVKDIDESAHVFGDKCVIDCNYAISSFNLLYVNYSDANDVRTIRFSDFQVGDTIIVGLYDREKENAFNGTAIAEQIQLGTQRMNQSSSANTTNDDNLDSTYYLTIGAEGVKGIELSMPHSSGGCENADGSLFTKGERIWLENLDGYTDLRGLTITALGENGEIIWTASIPNEDENKGFTYLVNHDWEISDIK